MTRTARAHRKKVFSNLKIDAVQLLARNELRVVGPQEHRE
jgi:hypothetical protein